MNEVDKIVRQKLNYTDGCKLNLQDYLRVLEASEADYFLRVFQGGGQLIIEPDSEITLRFDLTTGKSSTKKDAEEFIKLVEKV